MRLSRDAVLTGAFAILDRYGLPDLTMRRLAGELGVQPGGLYWHFANKQTLLAAMADVITGGVGIDLSDTSPGSDWRAGLIRISRDFRDALLAHRDGAELVAAGYALRPGSGQPLDSMIKILDGAGLPDGDAGAASAALTHFVLGHAAEVQNHDQLRRAGALPQDHDQIPDPDAAFSLGLSIFLDGVAARLGASTGAGIGPVQPTRSRRAGSRISAAAIP